MLILVTNDDGVYSPGLKVLAKALKAVGDVWVVAPDKEQSAVAHSLTLHRPLLVEEVMEQVFAVNGTPTDCVNLAVNRLLPGMPDLVVSGINKGGNLGDDVTYSGTVSAATEGTVLGLPSFAISLTTFKDAEFTYAAKFGAYLAQEILQHGLPRGVSLNVNVPNVPEQEIRGVAITRMGNAMYDDKYEQRIDPRHRVYYWLTGSKVELNEGEETDDGAIAQNLVSVTPLHFDLTKHDFLATLQKWRLKK